MTLTFVTSLNLRSVVEIDGKRFILRPLTFGEAGELHIEDAVDVPPSQAVLNDALRDALRALKLHEDVLAAHIAAVDNHEAEDDALISLLNARPLPQEPADAAVSYRAQLHEANLRILAASRQKQKAEWLVRGDTAFTEMRGHMKRQERLRGLRMLAISIEAWEGEELPALPDDPRDRVKMLATMPAVWLNTLLPKAMALNSPGITEAKN